MVLVGVVPAGATLSEWALGADPAFSPEVVVVVVVTLPGYTKVT